MSSELDLDFTSGSVPSGVTATRSGSAWYFNSSGVLTSAGTNTVRIDYDPVTLACRGMLAEATKTQSIRNATGSAGLVAGTPGTVPTNWVQQANATGVTRTIIGSGTTNGMPYVDFKYSGTATASDSVLFFEPSSGVATVNATTWTSSLWLALIGGSLTNVTVKQGMRYRAAAGANIGTQIYETTFVPTATLTRYERTATGSDATIAFVAPSLCLTCASGAVDLTLRISIPQLELGLFASSPLVSTTATLTRGNETPVYSSVTFLDASVGTMTTEWQVAYRATAGSQVSASLDDNSTNNRFQLFATNSSGTTGFAMVNGAVSQVNFTDFAAPTTLTTYRHGAAWALNDTTTGRDGTVRTSDTVCTIPTVTQLRLGHRGGDYLDGWLRRYRYWPIRHNNTDLASLTSAPTAVTGTAAGTLDALTSSAAGNHIQPVTGTAASTLDALTSSAAGMWFLPITGTAAGTLDALTSAASGATVSGTAAGTLDDLTSAAAGDHIEPRTGTAAGTLDDLTSSAAGMWFLPVTGTAASTLDALTSSAAGDHIEPDIGTAGGVLADLTSSASGVLTTSGAGASTLDDLDQDADGGWWEIIVEGIIDTYLSNLTGTASGIYYTPVTGTASRTLDDATTTGTGTAAGGSASTALDALSQAAQGAFQVSGAGAAALRDLDSFGFGTAYTARRVQQKRLSGTKSASRTLTATVR